MDLKYINDRLNYLLKKKQRLIKEINEQGKLLGKTDIILDKDISNLNNNWRGNHLQNYEPEDYILYRQLFSDRYFYDKVKPIIDKIPDSNGCKFYCKKNKNIAIVTDEFMYNFYKDAANLFYINYKTYKDVINKNKIDILMFVTCWKGMKNRDWRGIASSKDKKKELYEIISYAADKGIKTVFQSIEDPSNYDYFVDIAKKCDYIFTTAKEKVKDYKRDCNNQNVWVLEFGVNPLFHNPIGFKKFPKFKEIFFAGSWTTRYSERCEDMTRIFDGVLESGKYLKIIDRNYDLNSPTYFYPRKYIKYISPAVNHSDLQKIHKLFDWAVNLNSIKYSETMCAMRVYELQALGNIMLSNYSIAVNNNFPNIFIINDKEEVKYILNGFTEEEKYRHQVLGIRNVMSNATVFDRFNYILEKIGFTNQKTIRKVLVLVEEITDEILEVFNKQTYKHKELLKISQVDNEKIKDFDIITFFTENYLYEEFYLEDMINGFKYTNCDYVTKDAYYDGNKFIEGIEHDYVETMKDKYVTVFWRESIDINELIKLQGHKQIPNGYSIDRFEFNKKKIEKPQSKVNNYKVSVIIPVYNNGDHLLSKCFNSLRRSSLFNDMEILIVDDGSTDEYTPMIIKRLERYYPNVKTYFFKDSGSGSASRPRNKGMELSTSPYITFLDPDNEAINDGYYKLYKEIIQNKYDFIVGNIKKLTNNVQILRYYNECIIDKPKEHLIKTKFKPQSIQASIIDKRLIKDNKLKMVVGAVGQDTLFFQELMLNANKVKVVNENIHIYYAAVSGSTVNKINKSFFEKSYNLEVEAVKKFILYDVLNYYKENKFEFFFKNWYLEKFKYVKREDAKESIKILYKIYELYKDNLKLKDDYIKNFIKLYEKHDYDNIIKEYII